ncbi:FAD-binding protein [uncultured Ferrovibrio sp.]|uniref:FAD-binding protein n=1 Tax=uncultured Ferrovibrio sp. TaxID=1576913 RepID=UPI00262CAC3F|nr:FAD-binding protein [uncultured Ferrovibrio sp.]
MTPRDIEVAEVDILVLGGGIAGYRAAIAAREAGARVGQAYLARGASPYIIGANVPLGAVDPRDAPEQYATDMLEGGYHLNDRRLVKALAENAVASFEDLVRLGIPFARDERGYRQRHLSGNRYPRSVYIPEGLGKVMLEHLVRHAEAIGVSAWSGYRVVALLRDNSAVVGALLADRRTGQLLAVHAGSVLLAMGGIGQLYHDSTYPADVAADAYALALEAGATLIDMEFVQFEPVVVVEPSDCRGMEMPTAMLGDGAHLLNAKGERFMFRYNPEYGERQIEKARMSLCIQQEIDEGRAFPDGTVLFDTTVVPPEKLESYVSHCRRLRNAGLEPRTQGARVRPAAHSEMGGISIDADGWTGVPGLYAVGEASGGVHGASRLAGNGGGETIAMGWLVGRAMAAQGRNPQVSDWNRVHAEALDMFLAGQSRKGAGEVDQIKQAIRAIMSASAGLFRTAEGLRKGLEEMTRLSRVAEELPRETLDEALGARSCRNMTLVAGLILQAALARTESRGAHQRRDYPDRDDSSWLKHIGFRREETGRVRMDLLALQ